MGGRQRGRERWRELREEGEKSRVLERVRGRSAAQALSGPGVLLEGPEGRAQPPHLQLLGVIS